MSLLFSCSVVSDSLRPHGPQHARPPCPSPTPRVYLNSCPSSRWCHPTISSSVIPFNSCPQSLPASGSFSVSPHFTSGGQSIGASASASVLPMNTQGWFLLEWTGLISLQSKGLSRVLTHHQNLKVSTLNVSREYYSPASPLSKKNHKQTDKSKSSAQNLGWQLHLNNVKQHHLCVFSVYVYFHLPRWEKMVLPFRVMI